MRRRTRAALFAFPLLALALFPAWVSGQQEEMGLRMDVDKRQVQVGDTVTVSIEFKQVGNTGSVETGDPVLPTSEYFEIQGQSSATQVTIINQQTAMVVTTRYTLAAIKPGEATLGPALLIYQDPQGKKREIQSNKVTVTVVPKKSFSLFGGGKSVDTPTAQASPAGGGDDLSGVKPLVPEGDNLLRILFWAFTALVILGFLAWRLSRRPSKTAPLPVAGKAAQLRQAWKNLGKDDLDSKEFCLGLAALVRECLQYRFGINAIHSTTGEILERMKGVSAAQDEREAAEKCLRTTDRVLYADGNLTGRENLRTLCSSLLPKVPKS